MDDAHRPYAAALSFAMPASAGRLHDLSVSPTKGGMTNGGSGRGYRIDLVFAGVIATLSEMLHG